MSTLISKNIQIGADGTATNNFTLYQPATPDGTLRLGNGNTGITSSLLTLTSAGNFGVGTTSPQRRLHVRSTPGATYGDVARFESNGNPGPVTITFGDSNTVLAYPTVGCSGNSLVFGTNAAERMRLDSSGYLRLNNTDAGNYLFKIKYDGSSQEGIGLQSSFSGAGNMLRFLNSANTTVGLVSTNNTTTTYGTSSDYRLKENIQPMVGALAKVAALRPCTYKWKADGSEGEGFIAHELAEVVPQCVTGEKDAVDAEGNPVYQGIDTSFLAGLYAAALQELMAEVNSLKAEIQTLKGN